jgi:hypothetical protein
MRVELMRDTGKAFPIVEDPTSVLSLCVWHCKYRDFSPINAFKNLQTLKIASFPDSAFDALVSLPRLEWLSVLHLPKVQDLEAIGKIKRLRFLELQTLPSWDASGKRTVVESLGPLTKLSKLEHISLIGVVPKDLSLAALQRCSRLKSAKFQGYSAQVVEQFFQTTGVQDEHMPGDA